MSDPPAFHVSPNRLEGSLCDVSLARLLESCKQHLITGTIEISTDHAHGAVELRAGGVDAARFADLQGNAALRRLKRLGDGMYTLAQRLPTLSGELADSARCEGELEKTSVVQLMRLCEEQALSCTITVIADFDRAEICYRGGEITHVIFNGVRDDDMIVNIVALKRGRYRVAAPPLAIDIAGWPATSHDPTGPFRIEHVAPPPSRRRVAQLPGVVPARPPAPPARRAPPSPPARIIRDPAPPMRRAAAPPSPTSVPRPPKSPRPPRPPAVRRLGVVRRASTVTGLELLTDDDGSELSLPLVVLSILALAGLSAWLAAVMLSR